jgi:hypothetical protein
MGVDLVSIYNDLSKKIWHKMVDMLGIYTVIVLIQRTVWLTAEQYEEAKNIKFNEGGILYDDLVDKAGPERSKIILEEFFSNIIGILTKLIGDNLAKDIEQEINNNLKGE